MRGAGGQPIGADGDSRAEVDGGSRYGRHTGRLRVGHCHSDARPLEVVVGVAVAAFHRAGVVNGDGVVARREVGGEVGQQASCNVHRSGVIVEGAGEGAQRIARIACAGRAGAGVLVVGLADIDGLGVACAVACRLGHRRDGDPGDDLVGQRHAGKAYDAHVVVGAVVELLTGIA